MEKMDDYTKTKLIYSLELGIFSIAFLVIGILELTHVFNIGEKFLNVFRWITIFGSAYILFDFFYSILSKKRREKICLLDKSLTLPLCLYVGTIDVLLFCKNEFVYSNPNCFIPPIFLYVCVIYAFEAIYHWFYPLKELFDEEEAKK